MRAARGLDSSVWSAGRFRRPRGLSNFSISLNFPQGARARGLTRMACTTLLVPLVSLLQACAGSALADADQGASARVDPAVTTPGAPINLVFSVSSPELLEIIVQGRIECFVTSPAGQQVMACARAGPLADVRLVGEQQREYVFPYNAPAQMGTYQVHFEVVSTLTLLPATYAADASFRVEAAGTTNPPGGNDPPGGSDPSPGGNNPSGTPPPGGNNGGPDDPGQEAGTATSGSPSNDAARWLVSSTVAAGVVTVTLVAIRWKLGEIP